MSRRNQRRAQNAASLIRPSAVVKLCGKCGRYAIACYDLEGQRVGELCQEHRREAGYCIKCGNALTAAERKRPDGYCDGCIAIAEAQREREEMREEMRAMSRWY